MNGQSHIGINRCTLFPRSLGAEGSASGNSQPEDVRYLDEEKDKSDDRCTIFPTTAEARNIQLGVHTSDLDIQPSKTGIRRLQKRGMPQQWLQIPVKGTDEGEEPYEKRPTLPFCKDHTPWMKYQKFKEESKPGKTCLAYSIDFPGTIVAMKQYRKSGIDKTCHLQLISHPNIVNLLDAFEESKTLYLIYELMELSLEQLQSGIQLKESELAFISKELLHGLWYIHRDLAVCHTALTSDNIFISSKGCVKIANIGASLLERHQGSEQLDIKYIGRLLYEIVEPGCTISELRGSGLRVSQCTDRLQGFISKTANATIQALLQDIFISHAAGEGCLVVPIMKIRGLILHDYD